jgi:prevent-host-death family protein
VEEAGVQREMGRGDAPNVVSVRALRQRFGQYLAAVRAGQELIVTRRGKPIARIVPLTPGEVRLAELVAKDNVRRARPGPGFSPEPLETEGPLSDIVLEQRR